MWMMQNNPGSYLDYLSPCFELILFTLAIPYAILALSIRIYDFNNMKYEQENTNRMRFYDVNHNLKFVVTADSILYIGAEENYINIYYTDNGRVRCYVLRSSMRSVDELCLSNGLVRCHRSFYVNPTHVRVLRKDKEGFVSAQLDVDDVRDIPVSKKFYNNLAEML
jgi:DNA-binding LytR/AlgR family response regulator